MFRKKQNKYNIYYIILVDLLEKAIYDNSHQLFIMRETMALTKEQHQIRKSGIGGSDCAAILGLSKWKTPFQVYLDKVIEDIPEDNHSPFIEWGNRLEPLVIQAFCDKTGKKCELEPRTLRHPKYPWMLANIDARVVGENAILECKTAGQFMAKEWSKEGGDSLPESYMLQCAHYAEVCDVDIVYVAVLIGGNDFRIYHYVRNQDIGHAIIEAEKKFWNEHVIPQVPPMPVNVEDSARLWNHICNGTSVEADYEIVNSINKIKALKSKLKSELDVIQQQINNEVMIVHNHMKDAELLNDINGNTLATWKNQTTNRFDVKSFKDENPDIYGKYMKESNCRVFKLKGDIL